MPDDQPLPSQPLSDEDRALLQMEFCGMHFNTPLVLLSGCVGFGREYTRVRGFSHDDVGAVCLKGTTWESRQGNPPHRLAETPSGLLNAIGLQNPGADAVVKEMLPLLDHKQTRFIANVSGSTVEEYARITALFDDSPIAAVELNVSCPNVQQGGLIFGNDAENSAKVVAACRQKTDKPLIVKMSPNQSDIANNAKRCLEAGADAFAVINTMTGMAINIERRQPILGNRQGGVSGPAIRPLAIWRVHQVYQVCRPHGIPIIGQGGLCSGEDAVEFMLAGACAVGVGTALFYDPLVCAKINRFLCDYLRRHKLKSVSELTGAMESPSGPVTESP